MITVTFYDDEQMPMFVDERGHLYEIAQQVYAELAGLTQ